MRTSTLSNTSAGRVISIGLVWIIAFVGTSISAVAMGMPFVMKFGVRRALVCLSGAAICWLMTGPMDRIGGAFGRRMVLAMIFALPGALIYAGFNTWIFIPLDIPKPDNTELIRNVFNTTGWVYFVFLSWSAIYLMRGYERDMHAKDLALSLARGYALESQNRMLRYQISPHFLFNTLNAISTLILDGRNETAELVVLSLSRFLRHSLEKNPGDKVSLAEELEAQRQYLAIEKIRFSDRLTVEERISDQSLDARVPSLILQPLIENAVKYAVAPSPGHVTITISAEASGKTLRLQVTDNGRATIPPDTPRMGIGLNNVKGRLDAAFGPGARLETGPRVGGGFVATLFLPLERH